MPGLLSARRGVPRRRLAAAMAVVGTGAVLVAAAAPSDAMAASHHPTARHHHHHARSHHQAREFWVHGLVAAHHNRTVTVFAETVKVGRHTRHDRTVRLHFAHAHRAVLRTPVGDAISVHAVGRVHGKDLSVARNAHHSVTASPASLFFGTVDSVNANGTQMVVTELNRDNGDLGTGRNSRHGDGGQGRDGQGSNDSATAHHRSSRHGHQITVDVANADVTVDGSTDTPLAAGDTVAVLGESTEDTVVAAQVFGFSQAPGFLRGEVSTIDGDTVVLNGDGAGEGDARTGRHEDGNGIVVSLAGVPLVVNGEAGAAVADLNVGDKLVLLGSGRPSLGSFSPELAFAFNRHDDHPCGHNGEDNNGGNENDG